MFLLLISIHTTCQGPWETLRFWLESHWILRSETMDTLWCWVFRQNWNENFPGLSQVSLCLQAFIGFPVSLTASGIRAHQRQRQSTHQAFRGPMGAGFPRHLCLLSSHLSSTGNERWTQIQCWALHPPDLPEKFQTIQATPSSLSSSPKINSSACTWLVLDQWKVIAGNF